MKKFKPSEDSEVQSELSRIFKELISDNYRLGPYDASNYGTLAQLALKKEALSIPGIENSYLKIETEIIYPGKDPIIAQSKNLFLSDLKRGHDLPLIEPKEINPKNKKVFYKVKIAFDELYIDDDYTGITGVEYLVVYNLDIENIHTDLLKTELKYGHDFLRSFEGYTFFSLDGSSQDYQDDDEDLFE